MGWYTRIDWRTGYGRVTGAKKERCDWCKQNEYRCESDEVAGTCDFRTLPCRKEQIIERLKQEKEFIDSVKEKIESEKETGEIENLVKEVFDKVSGMSIMMRVLQEEFGMDEKDIRKEVGFEKVSWAQKMKLLMKVKMMERTRGGK